MELAFIKPVYRVKAIFVPTPRTYSEARTLAARYPIPGRQRLTGHEAFKPMWDLGGLAPKEDQ